jgi:uncharacterized DUF497 family protein
MWDRHDVTVREANEALADVDAVWFDPDPKSQSSMSIRVIGYCPSRRELLTVILVREPGVDWLWGANGWPSNSADREMYGKETSE